MEFFRRLKPIYKRNLQDYEEKKKEKEKKAERRKLFDALYIKLGNNNTRNGSPREILSVIPIKKGQMV